MFFQLCNYTRRLIRVHVGQNQGDGLRPLILQSRVQRFDICLVHKGELTVLQRLRHLVQQVLRRLLPVGLLQDRPRILQPTLCHGLVGHAHLIEFCQDIFRHLRIQVSKASNLKSDLFYIVRLHILVEKGCLFRTQRNNHSCRLLRTT